MTLETLIPEYPGSANCRILSRCLLPPGTREWLEEHFGRSDFYAAVRVGPKVSLFREGTPTYRLIAARTPVQVWIMPSGMLVIEPSREN